MKGLITRGPKGHCRSPEYNQRFKNLTSEWNQKQQHFILHVSRSLLCIRFVAIIFWAEEVFEMCHLLWWIGQGGNFYSLFVPKNTNLVESVKILLPAKFRWILFSDFIGEVQNVSANQRTGWLSCFFWSARKKARLVEDVEILLPVKFCWILFSGFRGKVENVSANQWPGRPFCFSDPPEKHKLSRGRWDLASYQVSLNSVQRFQRSQKCLSQSEARTAILFFPDWPEKHKRGRRYWELPLRNGSLVNHALSQNHGTT